jgi:hypothetical protein
LSYAVTVMMLHLLSTVAGLLGVAVVSTPDVIPINNGMTWEYNMTVEAGRGARLADEAQREAGTLHAAVVYRIDGTKEMDGKQLLQFEMHRAGHVTNTDLITVNEKGIQCWGRLDEAGTLTRFDSPQSIVGSPVTFGTSWDFNTQADGSQVHQHYEIVGQNDVTTPAGTFNAFHIRGEQTSPGRMTIDRWFMPGIGIVKDVTETHSDSGELLRRISLELKEPPKVAPRPQIKARPGVNKLAISVGSEAVGESRKMFLSTTPKICARWQGRGLPLHAKIRVLWIAEEVEGVAPPDYTIDEATTTATASDSHGVFTLARPESGWTPGIYRVEFYVDGALADAAKVKITKSAAARF